MPHQSLEGLERPYRDELQRAFARVCKGAPVRFGDRVIKATACIIVCEGKDTERVLGIAAHAIVQALHIAGYGTVYASFDNIETRHCDPGGADETN